MAPISSSPSLMTTSAHGVKRGRISTPDSSSASEEPLEEKRFSIIVGCEKILGVINESLGRLSPTPLPVKFVLDDELDKKVSPWARDNRVIKHDGVHLIPAAEDLTISRPMLHLLLYCLTGPHLDRGDVSNCMMQFKGIGFEYTEEARHFAQRSNVTHAFSSTALEGGNLTLFTDGKGNKKAVIGTHSIALSYMSLNRLHIFDGLYFAETLFPPGTDILRMPLDESFLVKARNLYLLNRADPRVKCEEMIRNLLTPITDAERANLEIVSQAHILVASWNYTKRLIASELNVPYENIAWISQEAFHIDMDLCIIEDCVFVYDGDLAVQLLDELLALPQYKDDPLLLGYREYALEKAPYYRAINENNRALFESIGLKMVPVAGRFETKNPSFPDSPSTNLFNGLLMPTVRPKELAYSMNLTNYSELAHHFIDKVSESISKELTFRPFPVYTLITNDKGTFYADPLGRAITNFKGGIRCMTNMLPQNFTEGEAATSPATTLTLPTPSPALSESKEGEK